MKILKKLILVCPLIVLALNITKELKETKELEEEHRIPKPEKHEDVTVEECHGTLYTTAGKEIHLVSIGLYCKGRLINNYATRTEAEAARLQYLYDNGITDKEAS